MKATAQTLTQASSTEKSWVSVYAELFKARLTFLVLLTTLVGFYLGSPRGPVNYLSMLHALVGTALVAVDWTASPVLNDCRGPTQSGHVWSEVVFASADWTTIKMPDLNCFTLEAAIKCVEGTARSMGVDVV